MTKKESNESPFPRRLKEARASYGVSQKQLGINAGLDEFGSSARMNQYERGKHTPDFSTARLISKALNIPTAYLFAEDNDLAEVIKKYSLLSAEDKNKIIELLDSLINKKGE